MVGEGQSNMTAAEQRMVELASMQRPVFLPSMSATPVDRSVAAALTGMMIGFSKSEGSRQRIEQGIAKTDNADSALVTHSVELALSLLAPAIFTWCK